MLINGRVRLGSNCDLRHPSELGLECGGQQTFSAEGKALPVEPPPRCAGAYRSRSVSGSEASISAGERIRDLFLKKSGIFDEVWRWGPIYACRGEGALDIPTPPCAC